MDALIYKKNMTSGKQPPQKKPNKNQTKKTTKKNQQTNTMEISFLIILEL